MTGQGVRWAGMRAANRLRTPERAEAAQQERTAALVNELVDQLSRMRGAAMKVGQMISMVEFDGLPEDQRQALQAKLAIAAGQRPAGAVLEARADDARRARRAAHARFSEFEQQAFAAASIGQVHRAVTVAGDEVAVKVQYPGVAEAVETDMRNALLLLPLVKRLAPGLDARALFAELRERIGEELDYELEAQHQRRVERSMRGHPFIFVPRVDTALSTRRIRCPSMSRATDSRRAPSSTKPSATATPRSYSASTSGCSIAIASRSGILTRATTCSVRTAGSRS